MFLESTSIEPAVTDFTTTFPSDSESSGISFEPTNSSELLSNSLSNFTPPGTCMPLISESSSSSVSPTMAAPEADTLTFTASTTESSPLKLTPSSSTNLSFSSKTKELSLSSPPSTTLPPSTSSLALTPDSLPSKSSLFCSTNLSSPITASNFDPSNTLSPFLSSLTPFSFTESPKFEFSVKPVSAKTASFTKFPPPTVPKPSKDLSAPTTAVSLPISRTPKNPSLEPPKP